MSTDHETATPNLHGGAVHIPRSRGAFGGVLLIVLGAWAAVIPFIGPLFSYAYTPNSAWNWTVARGWLEVLPGFVALVAGVILLVTANRVTASSAAWLGIASGVWLVIGRDVALWLHLGSPGHPASTSPFLAALESLGLFSGIGAAITVTAAVALGRLSVRSVRDMRVAQRHERKTEEQRRKITESAYAAGRRDEAATHHDAAPESGGHAADSPARQRGGIVTRWNHHGQSADAGETSGATAEEQPQHR